MQRSAVRSRMQHLVAMLAGAVALVPAPSAAQPTINYSCQAVNPPATMCAGQGEDEVCLLNYRSCSLDYDGDELFEREALFFEDRGAYTGLFGEGDTRCYQGENFAAFLSEPDPAQYGFHRFILIFPAGYQGGALPVYVHFGEGSPGWVDQGAPSSNSWAQDFSQDPGDPSWEKGLYRGNLATAQAVGSEQGMLIRLLSDNMLHEDLHTKTDPSYAFLIPSGCSSDSHNGRPQLGFTEDDFIEAEHNRFSYTAVFRALQFIRGEYGIDHIYSGAQSGGGLGSFILARDLPGSQAFYAQQGLYRGALVVSTPFETEAMVTLFDPADTRLVDEDDNCADTEALVPSAHISEPLVNAFEEVGLTEQSASDDILNERINVPILHAWSDRDRAHAYDVCYSEDNIHGPIRDEIEARKVGPPDEPFEFSENFNPCIGSCTALNQEVIDCVEHGLTDQEPVIACALDWIDAINAVWDDQEAYTTPASCQASITVTSTTPPECQAQGGEI